MTTIIGIQGEDFALLASDSMTSYDDRPFCAKGMDKVVEIGDYVFSVAGDAIAGHIANHLWKPPRPSKALCLDDFVMMKIVPSFKAALASNGYDPKPDDKDAGWDMLLCLNGTLYQIDSSGGWMRDDKGLYAIGSGGAIGLGVIAALGAADADADLAVAIAHRAIEISTSYNIYTGGETQLVLQRKKNVG